MEIVLHHRCPSQPLHLRPQPMLARPIRGMSVTHRLYDDTPSRGALTDLDDEIRKDRLMGLDLTTRQEPPLPPEPDDPESPLNGCAVPSGTVTAGAPGSST